jgi:hypothetical protein
MMQLMMPIMMKNMKPSMMMPKMMKNFDENECKKMMMEMEPEMREKCRKMMAASARLQPSARAKQHVTLCDSFNVG